MFSVYLLNPPSTPLSKSGELEGRLYKEGKKRGSFSKGR